MFSAGIQPEACILNLKHILDALAVNYLFNDPNKAGNTLREKTNGKADQLVDENLF